MAEESKEYVAPKLKPLDSEFGAGMFVTWEDGDSKEIVLTNWGQYEKEIKDELKTAFHADVLRIDDREYVIGEKVIDTTSINLMKALKPFLMKATDAGKKAVCLDISRKGLSKETTYFIKELTPKKSK